ncbi:MAG: UvrD-helicase domain-containing protein [Sphaerochaeta sp.]
MADITHLLEALNGPQRQAVEENSRPLLVLAGAGSGKTRVITTKIAYAIESLGVPPWQILAVTFTNKAASEMKERVVDMLDGRTDAQDVVIRTFHSFGAWLLRRFGHEIGLEPNFTIYDDEDSLSLLASCYPNHKRADLKPVMRAISYAKDRGLGPHDRNLPLQGGDSMKSMFARYEQRLAEVGNVDFADLIGRSIELLRRSESTRQWCHRRFAMIMVDEYQDTNAAQFSLLRELVGPASFVCVVGDDDQSIYRFRGAEVANILSFPTHFANTRTIKLEQNYRSTEPILEVANAIIKTNKSRHPKKLWTDKTLGEKPTLYYVQDDRDEVQRVIQILRKDRRFNDSAVLYRTNAQSLAFETGLKQEGIPYKVIGALQFFDREEVKDALALLYLLINRRDEVSFRRIINKPTRGIGPSAIEKILAYRVTAEGDLLKMLALAAEEKVFGPKTREAIGKILAAFDEAARLLEIGDLVKLTMHLLEECGLLDHFEAEDRKQGTFRVQNLEQLVNAIGQVDQTTEGFLLFLEQLALDRTTLADHDPRDLDGVTLITMHNTKGLEFDRVFVVGLEESLFPGRNAESIDDIEEERRTFYVAATRAKRELYLLSAKRRMLWGRTSLQLPSRFLDEIDKRLLTIIGSPLDEPPMQGFFTRPERPSRSSWAIGGSNLIQQGFGKSAKPFTMKTERHTQTSGEPLFVVGQRVHSDAYGEGEVISSKERPDGNEVIEVQFFGGKKATYIAKYADIEKIESH